MATQCYCNIGSTSNQAGSICDICKIACINAVGGSSSSQVLQSIPGQGSASDEVSLDFDKLYIEQMDSLELDDWSYCVSEEDVYSGEDGPYWDDFAFNDSASSDGEHYWDDKNPMPEEVLL
jgi:hypothetical protein